MVMLYPSMPLFAIMELSSMSCSCSTFAIKCSWQNVNMLINLPWLLLMIHSSYELSLAMVSFMNMSYCCFYACFVMQCFVVSVLSSQSCLHNSVYAMLYFLPSLKLLIKLAMFTWVPSYFMCLVGS